jgi:hypothetical protein
MLRYRRSYPVELFGDAGFGPEISVTRDPSRPLEFFEASQQDWGVQSQRRSSDGVDQEIEQLELFEQTLLHQL